MRSSDAVHIMREARETANDVMSLVHAQALPNVILAL